MLTLRLALLSLLRRPARHIVLLLLLSAAAALPVFLIQMAAGLYAGLNRAAEPFPILAGAKGSPYQLVINTVFLRDHPIGNISYAEVTRLRESGKADMVLPLAFGDNFRGFPIVGAEKEIFEYAPDKKRGPWLAPAKGRVFSAPREAVLGAEAAARTGLHVGDTFKSIHGTAAKGKEHGEPFRVAGILAPVSGPYDNAILVSIEDIWHAHSHHEMDSAALGHAEEKGGVTAVLVHPKGYKEAMQLLSAAQRERGGETQLIFPSQTLIALYAMAGQSREFWEMLTGGLIAAAVLIAALAMYWDALSRREEFALLRALGAGRARLMRLMAAEHILLLAAGAASGWLLGWGAALLAARAAAARAAIVMDTAPVWQSAVPPLAILLLGTAAGIVPVLLARRWES